MKKFILGFIAGGVICATVTGFAVEYAVTANPYPIKVNGTETAIEGYNINDNTYFKLRDVADAVGGFAVGFSDNTITIDTGNAVKPEPTVAPTPIPSSEIPPQATELNPVFSTNVPHENGLTSDGIPIKVDENGKKYVSTGNISLLYKLGMNTQGYKYDLIGDTLYDADLSPVISNMPYNNHCIEYEYYETVLRPYLIKNCD